MYRCRWPVVSVALLRFIHYASDITPEGASRYVFRNGIILTFVGVIGSLLSFASLSSLLTLYVGATTIVATWSSSVVFPRLHLAANLSLAAILAGGLDLFIAVILVIFALPRVLALPFGYTTV